ncbi:amidohydrolase family protein [Mesorhizobium sp. AA23]|uniref:amidohydrolase family protein n=2 Tax=unclassified Mesorhizobium TaxID=325217 RepID=UPI0007FC849F|nr:amidohydrolase family protein [Mesorhizobium sp. AA23]OBQ90433.1 hydrolase [Mesorhizobium sp. AA23]
MPNPYSGPIIDAHHHLWDLSLGRHPWLTASAGERGGLGELDALRRNYLPEDYLRDAARHNIVASVHVEAGWASDDSVGETRWLETLDKSCGGVAARYVVHVPLASHNAAELIEAQAAFDRVIGIRDILSWDPDPARRFAARDGIMDDPAWRAGLGSLARYGLSFDLMVFPRQLAEAAHLAAAFPDQQFVLNHCGSPIDRDPEGLQRWRDGLRRLAERDNVAIKISDLVAYDHDWTLESLRPIVLHCIDCFGMKRAMFGSDFPVAGLHASFNEVYDSFKVITADLSRDEQAALFFGNAARIYRLDAGSSPGLLPA